MSLLSAHSSIATGQYQLDLSNDAQLDAIEAVHAATALYTSEPVVDQLLDLLDWPTGGRRLVDPSCGNGMFLVRALERLLEATPNAGDQALLQLSGWEFHPPAATEARQRVETKLILAGRSAGDARKLAEKMVICADFLTKGPEQAEFDLIAGNPPYLRRLRVPTLLRELYDPVVPDYAGADLLHAFLDRCVRCLRPGGRIGLVTADRWLAAAQGAALRAELGQRVAVAHLQRLDARSAFIRAKTRASGTPPRVHPVAVLLAGLGERFCRSKQRGTCRERRDQP
ncbi:N-6 DNA methylase, partial [Chromobacterium piscinae]